MTYALRMLGSINKWTFNDYSTRKRLINADPIGDLKTTENKLSLYKVSDLDPKKIDKLLIIALTSERPSGLDKFDFVILSFEEIRKLGLRIIRSPQNTRTSIKKVKDRHYDITGLYAPDLIILAKLFLKKVNIDKSFDSIKKDKVREYLFEALNNKIIKVGDLNPNVRKDLGICNMAERPTY
jgi:hypothetical protein